MATLYERLGGVYPIAAVIDDSLIASWTIDLNANPKVDEAHHRVSRAGFKYLVTEMVCWATGGPQKYTGRSMYDSHVHLGITESEWHVPGRLRANLRQFGVPDAERRAFRDRGEHQEGHRPADWRKVVSTASTPAAAAWRREYRVPGDHDRHELRHCGATDEPASGSRC